MIYKFYFTQKPWRNAIAAQVELPNEANFLKWFMENAPFGVRIEGKHEVLKQMETSIVTVSEKFRREEYQDIYSAVALLSEEESGDEEGDENE